MGIVPSTDRTAWRVMAMWHGQLRAVFEGNIYACLRYVLDQTGKSYAEGKSACAQK